MALWIIMFRLSEQEEKYTKYQYYLSFYIFHLLVCTTKWLWYLFVDVKSFIFSEMSDK